MTRIHVNGQTNIQANKQEAYTRLEFDCQYSSFSDREKIKFVNDLLLANNWYYHKMYSKLKTG